MIRLPEAQSGILATESESSKNLIGLPTKLVKIYFTVVVYNKHALPLEIRSTKPYAFKNDSV